MIDQTDIHNVIEDLNEFFDINYPQSTEAVLRLMEIVVEHNLIYHSYSYEFMNIYPYNSTFCPRFVSHLRRIALQSIKDSHRTLGGYLTLDSQLYWNFETNSAEFNSYTDDISLSNRYE